LEFYEVHKISVLGNNGNSIFAKGNFNGKVLAVRFWTLQVCNMFYFSDWLEWA